MKKAVVFRGVIGSVAEDGLSAIVLLDKPVDGLKFAIVSSTTMGRVKLLNGKGRLIKGLHVHGTAVVGVEALDVLNVLEEAHA